jgi:hypothetical protein
LFIITVTFSFAITREGTALQIIYHQTEEMTCDVEWSLLNHKFLPNKALKYSNQKISARWYTKKHKIKPRMEMVVTTNNQPSTFKSKFPTKDDKIKTNLK